MRNSFKSIGKVATLLASTALLMATTAIIPAEAANKAGGSCSKVNAKARIGGDSYVCTKNPTVKNAKLTWVWVECINADKNYTAAATRVTSLQAQVAAAQTKIDTLKAGLAGDETQAKAFDAKAATAQTKKDAARRKSFCARMSGMPGAMKDEKGRPTRKALSLKAWNC